MPIGLKFRYIRENSNHKGSLRTRLQFKLFSVRYLHLQYSKQILFYFMYNNVFIAGGAGLLGINMTAACVKHFSNVVSSFYSRLPPKSLENHFQKFDFLDFSQCLFATKNKDLVFIFAVIASGVKAVNDNPTASLMPNIQIHYNLLEACRINQVKKIVWVSSSTVYQEAFYPIREEQLDLNYLPYETYLGIGSVYRYIETLCQFYMSKFLMDINIIRTSNIYGPFDRFDLERSHVIPGLIRRALSREDPFVVWGNKNTIRDFVYVDDLVLGILKLVQQNKKFPILNISSGAGISIQDLLKIVLDLCNHNPKVKFDNNKPIGIPFRVLDNTLANTILDMPPKTSIEEGLQITIKWYLSDNSRD